MLPEKPVCKARSNSENQTRNNAPVQKWERYVKAVYYHPAYLTYMQSTSCEILCCMKHKVESRLLGGMLVAQLCLTIWDPMDCIWDPMDCIWDPMDYLGSHGLSGSFVHGFLQAGILECVAYPFSKGYSQPRDQTLVSHIAGRYFPVRNINNFR